MRPSNKQRSRNKPGNNGNGGGHNNNQPRRSNMGNIINRVFESAGPDGKVRGTPQQIIDKYQALARDAQVAGDRVTAESYLQHSEHYGRLLGEAQRQQMETRMNQERDEGPRGDDSFDSQRRQQPAMGPSVASGLTMIDPDDSYDMSGPIETPEGRRFPADEPAPVMPAAPAPAPEPEISGMEFAAHAPQDEAAPEPVKRSRPRRRVKAEAPGPVTQGE